MPLLQWDNAMTIISPYATISLNTDIGDGRKYLINHRKSVGRRLVRVSTDNVPQGDGEIFHERYATGYEMQICVRFMDGEDPACDQALCEMRDQLYGVLWSLLRPADDGGRITWDSWCGADRILDAVRLFSLSDPEEDAEEGATEVTFVLDSPFPYAISLAENVVGMSGTVTLPNNGNVEFYPVFKINGPTGAWSLENNATGQIYLYDSSRPGAQAIGGGEYAEIDMFRGGLIYLNGDQDNLKPAVDVEASDILTVAAGGTSYTLNGASGVALMHDAWA